MMDTPSGLGRVCRVWLEYGEVFLVSSTVLLWVQVLGDYRRLIPEHIIFYFQLRNITASRESVRLNEGQRLRVRVSSFSGRVGSGSGMVTYLVSNSFAIPLS